MGIVETDVTEKYDTKDDPEFYPGATFEARPFITKDSGQRQEFDTGMVRDTQDGKPRYDLIPSLALKRVALLYARGADKYGESNWMRGQPYSRTLASLERHLHEWKQGTAPEEDHLAAVAWNALALMFYEETGRDELDDIERFNV
jgi:hypothetical protein